MFWRAVNANGPSVGVTYCAELGSNDEFVAPTGRGAPKEAFVLSDAVHRRGIEQGDPVFDRMVNYADSVFRLSTRTVVVGQAQAAIANRRDVRSASSKSRHLHPRYSRRILDKLVSAPNGDFRSNRGRAASGLSLR